jgi:poly(A) polymerase
MSQTLSPDQERLLGTVREALAPGQVCYLVGGAVRDYLLGRPLHDLDFALPEDPTLLAKRVAGRLNAGYFVLDDQRHTARVVYKTSDGHAFPLDFVQFTGETLEEDLGNRDFTLNAMAFAVDDPETVIDPLHGQADLEQGILRPCSLHALVDDPVRILRAVRLAKQFSLEYAPGLDELAQAAARDLPNTSAERQRDELFRILEGPDPSSGIADAERFGAFSVMIPALGKPDEYEIESSRLDQALSVASYFKTILRWLNPSEGRVFDQESPLGMLATKLAPFREKLQNYFSEEITMGRSKSSLTLFSLLLLGKSISEATPELARETARRYQMSNAEADWVQNLVQENRAVQEMVETFDLPDRRAIYLYFKNSGEAGVANALLFLAKCLATPGKLSGSEWDRRLRIVETLLTAWWEEHRAVINPRLLLNGHDLQNEFGLPPGAMIGQLLAELKEAQAAGTVLTLDDARVFITKAIPIPGESDVP